MALAAALPGDVADEEVQIYQGAGVVGAVGMLHRAAVEVGHRLPAHGGKIRGRALDDRRLDAADGGTLLHRAFADAFLEHGVDGLNRNSVHAAGVFQVGGSHCAVVMG